MPNCKSVWSVSNLFFLAKFSLRNPNRSSLLNCFFYQIHIHNSISVALIFHTLGIKCTRIFIFIFTNHSFAAYNHLSVYKESETVWVKIGTCQNYPTVKNVLEISGIYSKPYNFPMQLICTCILRKSCTISNLSNGTSGFRWKFVDESHECIYQQIYEGISLWTAL